MPGHTQHSRAGTPGLRRQPRLPACRPELCRSGVHVAVRSDQRGTGSGLTPLTARPRPGWPLPARPAFLFPPRGPALVRLLAGTHTPARSTPPLLPKVSTHGALPPSSRLPAQQPHHTTLRGVRPLACTCSSRRAGALALGGGRPAWATPGCVHRTVINAGPPPTSQLPQGNGQPMGGPASGVPSPCTPPEGPYLQEKRCPVHLKRETTPQSP